MRTFTIGEILKATGGTLYCGSEQSHVLEIATDSRKAKAGDIFFALKGEVTDGHLYLDGALRGGCRSLVVSEPEKIPQEAFLQSSEEPDVIVVKDTTRALQDLAAYYLAMLPLRHKIAVTGSVGKTSTRDMLYYALRTKYKTARSMKNFNNGFGLPLSILEFPQDTEVAVLEMGMDDFGEIERLADLVRPDIALITNIGISHIEKLGSREGILQAKMEVTTYFGPQDTLIVNADCDLLTPRYTAGDYHLLCVGSEPQDDFVISEVQDYGDKGIKYRLRRKDKIYEISSPLPGAHNAGNQALVIAAAELLGIPPEEVEILAPLDVIQDISDRVIWPFLARVSARGLARLSPSIDEVKDVFFVPVGRLLRGPDDFYRYPVRPLVDEGFPYDRIGFPHDYPWRRGWMDVPIYEVDGHVIWGMTGRTVRWLMNELGQLAEG